MPPPEPPPGFPDIEDFMYDLADEFLDQAFQGLPHPRLRRPVAFNLKSVRNLQVADRFIPLSTLYYFLDFAFEGNLPSGGKTTKSLMLEEEIALTGQAYAAWAPAPWNRSPGNMQSRLLDQRDGLVVTLDARMSRMRARLWEGLAPMSGARWKEKKLDDPDNWQFVFEFLYNVLEVFIWLGHPDVTRGIKDNFNYVAKELETFQHAINARRERNGIEARLDMTGLWLEYITSVFETMVTRSHNFFLDRVNDIFDAAKAQYDDAVDARGEQNCYEEAKKFGESWSDLNRLLHQADFAIMMPMDGFIGFSTGSTDSKVVGSMFSLPFRRDQMKEIEAQMPWPVAEREVNDIYGVRRSREKMHAMLKESRENHVQVRQRMRGDPKQLGREHWISIIKSRQDWSIRHGGPQDQRWGFVAYMLTHKPTEEEWEAFKAKLYADFAKSGEWVDGFEDVKQDMDLQWIDAKEAGIPHDNIEAARRHFQTFAASPQIRKRAMKQDFFVIDTESYSSYMHPPPPRPSFPSSYNRGGNRVSHGDYGGYLKLIDLLPYPPQLITETAPGYKNELKVLGSLVFHDLYPQLAGFVQRPRDLWGYACWHPNQVYVGPTVESQEKEFEMIWKMRGGFWKAFWKWRSETEREGGEDASST